MELFKLIPTTWTPGDTINNFNSLIWTERYQTAGDFQLVVENDISVLVKLPVGTLISHTDTKAVMMVENHEIDRNADKKLIVTVTGRTFETFTENRLTLAAKQPLEDGSGNAITETLVTPAVSMNVVVYLFKYALMTGFADTEDVVANINVRSEARAGTSYGSFPYVVKRADIYSTALEFLNVDDTGVKTVRPNAAQTTLDLVCYDGVDRTTTVIFYAQNEDLTDAKYFWSVKDYKNAAYVAAKVFSHKYWLRDLVTEPTGLNRRVLQVEASDLETAYVFGSTDQVVSSRAQNEMYAHPFISLLQATVTRTAKPKFKIHYDVGDLVTAFGEFGVADTMRVTEHILTKDAAGVQGYPSLSAA